MIDIVGLGPGRFGSLPIENFELLKDAQNLWLRTDKHPLTEELAHRGINYQTFDSAYEKAADFSVLYRQIAARLKEMSIGGKVTYAVPGHPLVAEEAVKILLADNSADTRIYPAMSCIDAAFSLLGVDPIDGAGIAVADALTLSKKGIDPCRGMLILQVFSQKVCSDLKLTLMETYQDDFEVCLFSGAGVPGKERIEWLPLYQLDRRQWVDHLSSVYIPAVGRQAVVDQLYPLDPINGSDGEA